MRRTHPAAYRMASRRPFSLWLLPPLFLLFLFLLLLFFFLRGIVRYSIIIIPLAQRQLRIVSVLQPVSACTWRIPDVPQSLPAMFLRTSSPMTSMSRADSVPACRAYGSHCHRKPGRTSCSMQLLCACNVPEPAVSCAVAPFLAATLKEPTGMASSCVLLLLLLLLLLWAALTAAADTDTADADTADADTADTDTADADTADTASIFFHTPAFCQSCSLLCAVDFEPYLSGRWPVHLVPVTHTYRTASGVLLLSSPALGLPVRAGLGRCLLSRFAAYL